MPATIGVRVGHFRARIKWLGWYPPAGVFCVQLNGVVLVAAVVSILTKKKTSLATLLLRIMLLLFAVLVWDPPAGAVYEMQATNAISALIKDSGLAGAAFFVSGVFRKEEAKPLLP